ncbi:hypothetical protein F5050DRAFT_1573542 [Lentinula boryana]|uniref:Ricin B lectin domain-containing protein n=1 Tax=Lentinula boryana TaxID=40481 RepID=A0ABQ8QAC6_9AGAR|nr:hypothetical protein F5050DRAFT_1573542 [Lentinula boryana]
MIFTTIIALLNAGLAISAPIYHPSRDVTLDPAAVAQAQVRDDTASRAFSAAQIQTSSGQCLAVDPASGDFRENLIPIQAVACNGSDTQQWDIITSGVHNNEPGFALVVSTLTNGCLNFDPRRAAGNQVLLFSCGGRADGSGAVTNSLFTFTGGAGPLPLVPQNGNNATCLTVNGDLLDQTTCDPTTASGDELFTISASGSQSVSESTSASTLTAAETSSSSALPSATTASAEAIVTTSSTASASVATGTTVLDPAAVAQAQVRDDTATRAFSAAEIQTSDGQCLSVDANSGDFRENLIPITVQACDGSAGQQWDVITAGVHNNVNGTALVVSTLTQGCLNFDPRRAAGDQVILFSCGGRADGSGNVTNSQLFTFTGASSSIPLLPTNQANTCLFNNNGNLDVTTCDTASPDSTELFTISASETTSSSASASATLVAPSASATPSSAEAIASTSSTILSTASASSTISAPASTGTTVLDPAAVAQAQVRDDTATRAFSAAEIQTSDGQCLSVDASSGDFRENLIPITTQTCDGSAGQQWDVITAGVHNNVPGTALFVSTLIEGCLNFDPRRATGNQVILFSCGGRADGSGSVTNSQLFTFTGNSTTIPLLPTNQADTCLFDNNGNLDVTSCDTANPEADEVRVQTDEFFLLFSKFQNAIDFHYRFLNPGFFPTIIAQYVSSSFNFWLRAAPYLDSILGFKEKSIKPSKILPK